MDAHPGSARLIGQLLTVVYMYPLGQRVVKSWLRAIKHQCESSESEAFTRYMYKVYLVRIDATLNRELLSLPLQHIPSLEPARLP